MKAFSYPSKEYIEEKFSYEAGKLFWRVDNGAIKAGSAAVVIQKDGELSVRLDGKLYGVAKLIYIMHNGDIEPGYVIENVNGKKADNRIENLKLVHKSQVAKSKDNNSISAIGAQSKFNAKMTISPKGKSGWNNRKV